MRGIHISVNSTGVARIATKVANVFAYSVALSQHHVTPPNVHCVAKVNHRLKVLETRTRAVDLSVD